MEKESKTVAWFSAGVSSAVAIKLVIDEVDEIIYNHIDDQHEDSLRFIRDCEKWFGKEVQIIQSERFKNVEEALLSANAIRFPGGAPCTSRLKQQVRKDWEKSQTQYDLTYIWGMDSTEVKRMEGLELHMPDQKHRCPLIEQRIGKEEAHQILNASGIKRPIMYDLGYRNNNCVGCIKGGKGYWNKIRVDFPEVFEQRSKLERRIGRSILKTSEKKGNKATPIFLDELDPDAGRDETIIMEDCGIMCEIMKIR